MALWLGSSVRAEEPPIDYNYDVRPILSDRCFLCHGFDAAHRKADLRLDVAESAYEKHDGGTPLVPGNVESSTVWQRINSTDPDELMPPPESHLTVTASEKEIIRRWIQQGARYEKHWSFVLPERAAPPTAAPTAWAQNPIDQFIYAKLKEKKLHPSPAADPHTLSRRLALDLIGLPPTGAADQTYAQQLEAHLSSPRFGERWALPWLDAARYSDSNGFQNDHDRFAWPWRDYIIRALNANKPQDQLIKEMIAGDLLENPTEDQLVATAFNRHHLTNEEGGSIKEEIIFNYVSDRVDAAATTFLGLTFACAQCHDHKYDPLSHEDYYRLYAFFGNMDEDGSPGLHRRGVNNPHHMCKPTLQLKSPEHDQEYATASAAYTKEKETLTGLAKDITAAELEYAQKLSEAELTALPDGLGLLVRQLRGPSKPTGIEQERIRKHFLTREGAREDWKQLFLTVERLNKALTPLEDKIPVVMIMKDKPTPPRAKIRSRGSYDQPIGSPLSASLPTAFSNMPRDKDLNRLDLARWLVSSENPLTARVLMNRLWQEFFGLGIVATPEDFGSQGALPTHPALLDWLAVEFIESGWDFKHMVRLITSSQTYQQSSKATASSLETDPKNQWLARGARFRMSSALIRDQTLAVSGLLFDRLYGPPSYPYQPGGLWEDVSLGKFSYPQLPTPYHQHSRSIYTFWRRTQAPPNMFDAGGRQVCRVKPLRTNTPLQALTLLNDRIYVEAAVTLARKALPERDALHYLFSSCTQRPPQSAERAILEKTMEREIRHYTTQPAAASALTKSDDSPETVRLAALTIIAQMVLNLDEVLNKE